MSDIIHLLPDSVANQIAAGEVVQRPASVLKELIENSIDAGATSIQIVIKDAGRTLIQITDNGKGMSETDARMAFERHATSKIKDASDLFTLRTLGFRGEAIPSIAAVAQVELRSKREEDELGVHIEIAGSRIFNQEPVQTATGTTIAVKNLFFNVPARRRFLKSDNVEKSHLLNEFYRIALVNPEIGFAYFDGNEEIYQLPPSNLKIRIENVFGKNNKKRWELQLLTVESNTNLVNIKGYIGKPEYAQRNANQYFFVNGRYMRHPYFHKAVTLAYDQLVSSKDNPNYFIYFEVDPQSIDVNIHPTKTEIKFENEQAIWSILSSTIKESLGKFNVVPSIDFDTDGALDLPVRGSAQLDNVRPPTTSFNPSYNPFSDSKSYKRPTLDWEQLYTDFETNDISKEEDKITFEAKIDITSFESQNDQQSILIDESRPDNFQLKNKYILTPVKSGMLIIDQQRAHIRILYDMYLKQMEHQASSQQVLFPEILELRAEDILFFDQLEDELKNSGFDFNKIESNRIEIKGVPALLDNSKASNLILEIISNAKESLDNTVSQIHESIAVSLAAASALKPGKYLTSEEMTDIIQRLFACPNHNFTPDGKKIMTILSYDEIALRFT